tara:strand:+ start:1797 stop:2018 length:222 start_codon:yes stop_codon:yes gene_type:complete
MPRLMVLARVDGSRLLVQAKETWQMIKIKNKSTEDQINEILQRTQFSSAEEYLSCRIKADFADVKRGKKLSIK